jgi:outer membrane receptor protein involved in Fe transport
LILFTKRAFLLFFIHLSLAFLFCASAQAQIISGIVNDSNGAAIENADVWLFDKAKLVAKTATDASGKFSIDLHNTQNSLLLIKAAGFASFSKVLSKGYAATQNIVLQPAAVDADVTVSITRTETRLSETPASIVVLDKQTLNETAGLMIDDKLRQIAGFTLFRRSSSRTSNPTTQGANLRGLAGSGASRAAITFDGVSLNDAFGGWTFWNRVPQIAVEQAEVLRGGASAFYGSSALSGVVNLRTTQPTDGKPVFRVQASGGSQNTYDGSIFAAAGRRGWYLDLALETFQTGGYIPVEKVSRGLADTRANSRHNSGFLTVERKFNESTRIFARGNLFAERRDNGTSLTNNRTYFRQLSAGADVSNRFGTFQLRSFVERQVYDQTFSAVSADRNLESFTRLQRVPSQAFGAEIFWTKTLGSRNVVAGSFDFRDIRGVSDETAISNNRATSLVDSGGRQRFFSGFIQDILRVSDKLNLSFALHYDHWKNFDASSTTQSLTTGQTTTRSFPDHTEQSLNPRVAALYQIDGYFSLVASYSRAFRAPTLNELYRGFRVGNVVTLANENLRSETADSLDARLNFTGFRRRLSVRGTAFFTTVSNPVVSITLSTMPNLTTRQRQNVGSTRARGIEADAEFRPRENLRFSASYLFTDSRVSDFPNDPTLVGKFLPQVARQQFTFQSAYQPTRRLSFSVQGRISDSQFEDDLNTLRLRPYLTADAFASYRLVRKLEVFAAVENVFSSRYDIGLTPVRTVAAPTFARVGLRFDLGKR